MFVVDFFDVKNYVVGRVVNNDKFPPVFVLSFFHPRKSTVRCVMRFEEYGVEEKIYSPVYSIKVVDTNFSLTPGAEKEFGRVSLETIKALYRPKFLCGGRSNAKANNQKVPREASL